MAKSGYNLSFEIAFPKSWLEPHQEHVDRAEEISPRFNFDYPGLQLMKIKIHYLKILE